MILRHHPFLSSKGGYSTRLALLFIMSFWGIGVFLPFFPVWLEDQMMTPVQISLILTAIHWSKAATSPLFSSLADRLGDYRGVISILATGSFYAFALLLFAEGFPMIFALSVLGTALYFSFTPLCEGLVVFMSYRHKLNYPRIRIAGSLTFIGASFVAGLLLDYTISDVVIWLILGGLLLTILMMPIVPSTPTDKEKTTIDEATPPQEEIRWRSFLKHKVFLWYLLAAWFSSASHSVFFAFGSIHWQNAGYSASFISFLWVFETIAEILLFLVGQKLIDRFSPRFLLVLCGVGGIVRWSLTAAFISVPALLVAQALHAATFGCYHLAVSHIIGKNLPTKLMGRAQSLYCLSLFYGILTPLAGPLYNEFGGWAFLTGVPCSLAVLVIAYIVKKEEEKQASA